MANVLDLYSGLEVAILERKTRVKRTEKDMIASVKGNPLDEAHYLKARLMKLEDKLSALLGSASPEALELILKGSPHYTRYLP